MAQQQFANGELNASVRSKLNGNAADTEARVQPLETAVPQNTSDIGLLQTQVNDLQIAVAAMLSLSPMQVIISNDVAVIADTPEDEASTICYVLSNSAPRTLTLPATAPTGARIQVQNGDLGGASITVSVAGGANIDFGVSARLSLQADFLEFIFDGTGWWSR